MQFTLDDRKTCTRSILHLLHRFSQGLEKSTDLDDRNAREARPGVMPLLSLLINSNIPKIKESDGEAGPNLKFTMFTQTTMHLVYPPKFCLTTRHCFQY